MSISDLRGSVAMANIPCEMLGDTHTNAQGINSLDGTQGNILQENYSASFDVAVTARGPDEFR